MHKIIFFIVTFMSSSVFAASPIDQRDPYFQLSMESLKSSITAIDIAKRELQKSMKTMSIPGLRYDLLQAKLDEVKQNLMQVTNPERRRLRYQELVPDSQYFAPPGTYKSMSSGQ